MKLITLMVAVTAAAALLACGTGEPRTSRFAVETTPPAGTPTAVASSVPTETLTPVATPTPVTTNTPLPPPITPTEPIPKPTPTRCAPIVLEKKGELVEVIGPGSEYKLVPSPADYVRDSCTGETYYRDPDTGDELPTTQLPA